ncbi:unnamed protein product [Pylaiella littoralis]
MLARKRVRAWEGVASSNMTATLRAAAAAAASAVVVVLLSSSSVEASCPLATAGVDWQHVGVSAGRMFSGICDVPKVIADAALTAARSFQEPAADRKLAGSRRITTTAAVDTGQIQEDSNDGQQSAAPLSSPLSSTAAVTTTTATVAAAASNCKKQSPAGWVVNSNNSGKKQREIFENNSKTASLFSEDNAAESETGHSSSSSSSSRWQWLRRGKKGEESPLAVGGLGETHTAGEGEPLCYSKTALRAVVPPAGAATAGYSEVLIAAENKRRKKRRGEPHLSFREALFAGALSRSIAHTCVHPAIVVKTILQGRGTSSQLSNLSFELLTRGSGAQFVMSLPHGAFNYATLEVIMGFSSKFFPAEWREKAGPALDFFTSGVATLLCSVISTPQIVIEDRIITGMYPNLFSGVREIRQTEGLRGFYTGWSANVSQKIPSYGLTWVFYQASKRLYKRVTGRAPTATQSFMLGAASAGGAVCVMVPLDMVLTRVVTQRAQEGYVPYKGVVRTLSRIIKEEGLGSMYGSLPAKLVSVVPAIGIQFGIYDYFRKQLISRKVDGDEGDQCDDSDEELGLLERDGLLPPSFRRRLGLGGSDGRGGDHTDDDFARKLYLLEEELL